MRRFIFSVLVVSALPLVILTWFIEKAATIPLVLFGAWWGLALRVLDEESRREHSNRCTMLAAHLVRLNPNDPWGARVLTFAEHCSAEHRSH